MPTRKPPPSAIVPLYRLRDIQTHLRRILSHTVPPSDDSRTVNTYRLARRDLRYLDSILPPKT